MTAIYAYPILRMDERFDLLHRVRVVLTAEVRSRYWSTERVSAVTRAKWDTQCTMAYLYFCKWRSVWGGHQDSYHEQSKPHRWVAIRTHVQRKYRKLFQICRGSLRSYRDVVGFIVYMCSVREFKEMLLLPMQMDYLRNTPGRITPATKRIHAISQLQHLQT